MMIKAPLSIAGANGYGAHNGVAVQDRTGLICAVAIGDVPELDADAMARLIVAAPSLAEKLENCVKALTFAINGWDQSDPWIQKLRATRDGAQEALNGSTPPREGSDNQMEAAQ